MREPIGLENWENELLALAIRHHGLGSLSEIDQMTAQERYMYYNRLRQLENERNI